MSSGLELQVEYDEYVRPVRDIVAAAYGSIGADGYRSRYAVTGWATWIDTASRVGIGRLGKTIGGPSNCHTNYSIPADWHAQADIIIARIAAMPADVMANVQDFGRVKWVLSHQAVDTASYAGRIARVVYKFMRDSGDVTYGGSYVHKVGDEIDYIKLTVYDKVFSENRYGMYHKIYSYSDDGVAYVWDAYTKKVAVGDVFFVKATVVSYDYFNGVRLHQLKGTKTRKTKATKSTKTGPAAPANKLLKYVGSSFITEELSNAIGDKITKIVDDKRLSRTPFPAIRVRFRQGTDVDKVVPRGFSARDVSISANMNNAYDISKDDVF